jgi:hypothetical protein
MFGAGTSRYRAVAIMSWSLAGKDSDAARLIGGAVYGAEVGS